MQSGLVIQAGVTTHPESDKRRLRVMVNVPYTIVGHECATTDVWCDAAAPVPADDTTILWDSNHVYIDGKQYKKKEDDSPSNEPLH